MSQAAEMRAALHAGKAAAEAREAPDSNPFASGVAPRERVLAVMWRKGYSAGNPIPR